LGLESVWVVMAMGHRLAPMDTTITRPMPARLMATTARLGLMGAYLSARVPGSVAVMATAAVMDTATDVVAMDVAATAAVMHAVAMHAVASVAVLLPPASAVALAAEASAAAAVVVSTAVVVGASTVVAEVTAAGDGGKSPMRHETQERLPRRAAVLALAGVASTRGVQQKLVAVGIGKREICAAVM